jgi:hypothetical protein
MATTTDPDVHIVVVDVKEVASGYRVSRMIGADVVNDRNETVGTVDDLMMSGDDRIKFAILQVGGFLGLGGFLVAIEFNALRRDTADGEMRFILPGATQEELKKQPEFRYQS